MTTEPRQPDPLCAAIREALEREDYRFPLIKGRALNLPSQAAMTEAIAQPVQPLLDAERENLLVRLKVPFLKARVKTLEAKYEALAAQYEKLKHEWRVEREGRKIADGEVHAVLRHHQTLVDEVRRLYEWNDERTSMMEVEFDGTSYLDPVAWPAHATALGQGSGEMPPHLDALREQADAE